MFYIWSMVKPIILTGNNSSKETTLPLEGEDMYIFSSIRSNTFLFLKLNTKPRTKNNRHVKNTYVT